MLPEDAKREREGKLPPTFLRPLANLYTNFAPPYFLNSGISHA